MKTKKYFIPWLLIVLSFCGCISSSEIPLPNHNDSDLQATAISTIVSSPSSFPASTSVTTTMEATNIPLTTQIIPTSSQTTIDRAAFVSENYPDNSVLNPSEKFDKTFELKNVGNNTWTVSYYLVLKPEAQSATLGSPSKIFLPQETSPGETVAISIPLSAPTIPGTYTVYWSLENEYGETISVDSGNNVWVKIVVCDPDLPCNPVNSGSSSSASGITASLTNFTYNNQSVIVSFCLTVPNRNYALDLVPSLLIDEIPATFLEGGTIQPWGCYSMSYQIDEFQLEQAQHIEFLIDAALRMAPPPGVPDEICQSAKPDLITKYPGLDFQCNFSGGGYYTDLQLPDGMTKEQMQQIIFDTIEGAIYGPWVLKIK